MLISVQKHLHKSGKIILVVVMGVVVLSLLYFGPAKPAGTRASSEYKIYGRTISPKDFEHEQDEYAFALTLQVGRPVHRNDVNSLEDHQRILAQLALLEKAKRLGVRVTDAEIGERIRIMPIFQVNGQFSPERLNTILSAELTQRHLSEDNFRDIIGDQIVLFRLNELVATTALVAPEEVDDYLELINDKTEIAVAKFDRKSFKAPAGPSEEELQAFYTQNAEAFRVPARYKVSIVEFPIQAPTGSDISDEELRAMYGQYAAAQQQPKSFEEMKPIIRKALLQQMAMDATNKRATEFSLLFATENEERPDFRKLAAEKGLKVRELDYMGGPQDVKGIKLPEQFFAEISKLSKENPVSLPIVGGDIMYVANWEDSKESSVPPLAEVRTRLIEAWKQNWALKKAQETGREARAKLEQLLAEGKSLEQAGKSAGISWVNVPVFSFGETPQTDSNRFYKEASLGLPVGKAGDFRPDAEGGFFVYVKKRTPPDTAILGDQKFEASMRLNEQTRTLVLYEFRQKVIEEAGLLPLFSNPEPEPNL